MQEGHFHIKNSSSVVTLGSYKHQLQLMGNTTLHPATPSPFSAPVPVLLQSHTEPGQTALAKEHFKPLFSAGLGPQAAHCIAGGMAVPAAMLAQRGQRDAKAEEGQALSNPAPYWDLPGTTAKFKYMGLPLNAVKSSFKVGKTSPCTLQLNFTL